MASSPGPCRAPLAALLVSLPVALPLTASRLSADDGCPDPAAAEALWNRHDLGDLLFEEDFEGPLDRWRLSDPASFSLVDSGDAERGQALEMRSLGATTHALIEGSETWGRYRLEGEVLFPTDEHNYLGFIYNLTEREDGRRDLGSLYIKGNGSYIRANPRRDWNPGRMLYEEYRTPLTGCDAIVIGEWQRFALEVDGSTAHLYVGDPELPKVTFDLFEGDRGAAGFKPRVGRAPVRIDNLRAFAIERLTYQGEERPPGIDHDPGSLITDWEVLGPLSRVHAEIEADSGGIERVVDRGREVRWRPFATDRRGAVVTARVVDFLHADPVAYFRTRLTVSEPSYFELSSIDDTAIWVDDEFRGYGYADTFAWHDFGTNPDHATRDRVALDPGERVVTIRVRGGRYAAGGFFARLAPRATQNDDDPAATAGP